MMKLLLVLLGIFTISQMVSSRPSNDVTRDTRVQLPGSERINKRSAENQPEDLSDVLDDSQEYYDATSDDYQTDDAPIVAREIHESNEDMENAESNIVFHPLFVSRKRSIQKKRTQRSADKVSEDPEELDTAENGLVFLPLFRSRNRFEEKQRVRREAEAEEEKLENDMDVAENGMVFLPLFRSKNRFEEKNRIRRSAVIGTLDDLEVAEDLVFKPVFARRFRPARSVQEQSLKVGEDDLVDDMAVAENGLIFRPLFRNKQRDE